VAIVSEADGTVTGTLSVASDGSYTFAPSPGFAGAVPPITVVVTRSDGVAHEVPLSLTVNAPLTSGSSFTSASAGGGPVVVNVLEGLPTSPSPSSSGQGASGAVVTGIVLPGSSTVVAVGSSPVTTTVPGSAPGTTAGTVTVTSGGTLTFSPAPSFSGQVPPITYVVAGADGQTTTGSATVVVAPGALEREALACMSSVSNIIYPTLPVSGMHIFYLDLYLSI
jgi:hypothetical protein